VSRAESIDDREEIEKEKATAPTNISKTQYNLSGRVTPFMSPKPTVVNVVKTKYIEAMYILWFSSSW
jgi:hypothetical protein